MKKIIMIVSVMLFSLSCDKFTNYKLLHSSNFNVSKQEKIMYNFTSDGVLLKLRLLDIQPIFQRYKMLHVGVMIKNLQHELIEYNLNQFIIKVNNNKLDVWKVRIGNRLVNNEYICQLKKDDETEIVYLVPIIEKKVDNILISLGNITIPDENKFIELEDFTFSPCEDRDCSDIKL